MVGSNGLEPSTSRLSGVRSYHLSYEPMSFQPQACSRPVVRPISALRPVAALPQGLQPLVEMNRFELSTPWLQSRCSPS